jgi:hypothetical protein
MPKLNPVSPLNPPITEGACSLSIDIRILFAERNEEQVPLQLGRGVITDLSGWEQELFWQVAEMLRAEFGWEKGEVREILTEVLARFK